MRLWKNTKTRTRRYYMIVSTLFLIVALLHFVRAINGWDLVLNGYVIPVWISWVVVVLLSYLVVRGLSYNSK